ncbi:MAG: exonuclease domain-containing protein [Micrococcales bacterium]
MPLDFTAIDFETANSSAASACAVGLVKVRHGKIVDSFETLIQPPESIGYWHAGNIGVHGINPEDVVGAPTLLEALAQMVEFIDGDILVAHNAPFDMGVLRGSAAEVGYALPELEYACSLAISRKTYHLESYRLPAVAYAVGYEDFEHHNALADTLACAHIIIHAAKRNGADTWDVLLAETKQTLKPLLKPAAE